MRQLEDTVRVMSGRSDIAAHYAAARADIQAALVAASNADSAARLAAEKEALLRQEVEALRRSLSQSTDHCQVLELTVARLETRGVSRPSSSSLSSLVQELAAANTRVASLEKALGHAHTQLRRHGNGGIAAAMAGVHSGRLGSAGDPSILYSGEAIDPSHSPGGHADGRGNGNGNGTGAANGQEQGNRQASPLERLPEVSHRFLGDLEARAFNARVVSAEAVVAERERRIAELQAEMDAIHDRHGEEVLLIQVEQAKQLNAAEARVTEYAFSAELLQMELNSLRAELASERYGHRCLLLRGWLVTGGCGVGVVWCGCVLTVAWAGWTGLHVSAPRLKRTPRWPTRLPEPTPWSSSSPTPRLCTAPCRRRCRS